MSDFTINIDSKLDLSKARSEINNFLNENNNKPIKVKVDVDKSSLSKLNLNTSGLKIKPTVDTSGIKQATKDFQMVKNLATQISQTKIKRTR